jgi:serine/threonine protein kinase
VVPNPVTPLSRYRILREIGSGAFATVKEAIDLQSSNARHNRVAIKIMNKARCGPAMCENEVKILTEVGNKIRHQRMTKALEVFEDDVNLYIVLELLHGGELFDIVSERGSFSEREVAQLVRKLVYALQSLHASSILHRDIKLENLVLIGNGKTDFKLIDFGLALDSSNNGNDAVQDTSGKLVGTMAYCSPEVLEKRAPLLLPALPRVRGQEQIPGGENSHQFGVDPHDKSGPGVAQDDEHPALDGD